MSSNYELIEIPYCGGRLRVEYRTVAGGLGDIEVALVRYERRNESATIEDQDLARLVLSDKGVQGEIRFL